ncbi:Polygalacturonase [Morella rubra]|uniref:Polygalacturonase n=1 Tax=Morella rubra TaxID=262757 RepID=A0A6A1W1H3_9ROSI|nr:Polygalacturonase [Morella rubra]
MSKLLLSWIPSCLVCMAFFQSSNAAYYNVANFGARPDGKTDSTQPFLRAWWSACNSITPATIYVPRGTFLLKAIAFTGPCKSSRIVFQIAGTLIAPSDYWSLGNSPYWILFIKVSGVSVYGGSLNANGARYWACRRAGRSCPAGSRSIGFLWSSNVMVSGLTSINSQTVHVNVNSCYDVVLRNLKISAPSSSPNTDGIHVQSSTGVTISSSIIKTGDDCISIGQGSRNLWIDHVDCGPGHGISIGSLGQQVNEDGVQNVTVTSSVFSRTLNGVRIKSWANPSNGYVRNVVFRNIIMKNVYNPIIIDQKYCPSNNGCPSQSSGVKISQVTYKNIKGTSASPIAMNFICSSSSPCKGIKLQDIKLTYNNGAATSSCSNAGGMSNGVVIPRSCLGK